MELKHAEADPLLVRLVPPDLNVRIFATVSHWAAVSAFSVSWSAVSSSAGWDTPGARRNHINHDRLEGAVHRGLRHRAVQVGGIYTCRRAHRSLRLGRLRGPCGGGRPERHTAAGGHPLSSVLLVRRRSVIPGIIFSQLGTGIGCLCCSYTLR